MFLRCVCVSAHVACEKKWERHWRWHFVAIIRMPQKPQMPHCKASPNLGLWPWASLVTMVTVSLVVLAVQSLRLGAGKCAVPCWNDALSLKTSSLLKSSLAFPVPLHYRVERISQMLIQKLMLPCKQHNPRNLLLDWLEDEKWEEKRQTLNNYNGQGYQLFHIAFTTKHYLLFF